MVPRKFMPVVTIDFHESIPYLFDFENLPKGGYDFFVMSQTFFQTTKTYLKKFNLNELYLDKIITYLKENDYAKTQKNKYEEIDWNWITQDFHLYIFRKYLSDRPFKKYMQENKVRSTESAPLIETDLIRTQFALELYTPVRFVDRLIFRLSKIETYTIWHC